MSLKLGHPRNEGARGGGCDSLWREGVSAALHRRSWRGLKELGDEAVVLS